MDLTLLAPVDTQSRKYMLVSIVMNAHVGVPGGVQNVFITLHAWLP